MLFAAFRPLFFLMTQRTRENPESFFKENFRLLLFTAPLPCGTINKTKGETPP